MESFDSSGTYYGSVFVNKDNVAVSLLREGFVQTDPTAGPRGRGAGGPTPALCGPHH